MIRIDKCGCCLFAQLYKGMFTKEYYSHTCTMGCMYIETMNYIVLGDIKYDTGNFN